VLLCDNHTHANQTMTSILWITLPSWNKSQKEKVCCKTLLEIALLTSNHLKIEIYKSSKLGVQNIVPTLKLNWLIFHNLRHMK